MAETAIFISLWSVILSLALRWVFQVRGPRLQTKGHPCEVSTLFRTPYIKHRDVRVRWEASDRPYVQESPLSASGWLLAICPPSSTMRAGGRSTVFCRQCDEVLAPRKEAAGA